MDLEGDIIHLDKKIDENLNDISDKLNEYKKNINIYLKIFSIDDVEFFFDKEEEILINKKIVYQEIDKNTSNNFVEIKTNFKLVNDILNYKRCFYNKNDFPFYFLYFTNNLESTFFYMIVNKVNNYLELKNIKNELCSIKFKDIIGDLTQSLNKKNEIKNFILKTELKKKIVIKKEYYDLIDNINVFLDDKITEDKISDISFLEVKLKELQNNEKIKEIIEKTNNLEKYFLEIKNVKQKIQDNESKLKTLKDNILTINNDINLMEISLKNKKTHKKVEKVTQINEITRYNVLINQKKKEIKELKIQKENDIKYCNECLKEYKQHKQNLEENNEMILLKNKIKKTNNKEKREELKLELEEIMENINIDIILVDNKINVTEGKIENLKNENFENKIVELNDLQKVKDSIESNKNTDYTSSEISSINKLLKNKKLFENEIQNIMVELKKLNIDCVKKNNDFNFKRVEFFKKSEKLFKEFSDLDEIINKFKEYISLLKTNLYNYHNNGKIIHEILNTNLNDYKNELQINIDIDDYFSDITIECFNEIKTYIQQILDLKHYGNLINQLLDFTSYCDEKLGFIIRQLINFDGYEITKIKDIKILNYYGKIELLINNFDNEYLCFDKDNLDNIISKKKYLLSMKNEIMNFKNELKLIENIKCD